VLIDIVDDEWAQEQLSNEDIILPQPKERTLALDADEDEFIDVTKGEETWSDLGHSSFS
jgi:hypothetical protein